MLQKVIGSECPRCGCRDNEPRGEPYHSHTTRAERAEDITEVWFQRVRCNHCGKPFRIRIDDGTISEEMPRWPDTVCPECGTRDCKVQSTPPELKPIRKMKCQNVECGHSFKARGPEEFHR